MSFGSKIWGFLRRPVATFGAVKEETLGDALKYALICLVIFGVFTGIMFALQWDEKPFLSIPIAIGLSIVNGLLSIFVGGAWTYLWVYLLGGRKGHGYVQTVKALVYGATPVYLVGWVLLPGALAGVLGDDSLGSPVLSWIFIGLGILVLIWTLVVTVIGLRELHGITAGRAVVVAVLTIGIPASVALLLALLVGTLLAALAPFLVPILMWVLLYALMGG